MRQYLIEGIDGAFPFIVDRTKPPVSESRENGSYTRIPGRFSVCDSVNGNKRRYRKPVWEKNLASGSILQESIKRNAAFGLLEHPKDGQVTLLSPISHHVTKAELTKTVNEAGETVWEVIGEIAIIETEEGKKLKALIEAGYNPMVSSRGYGSLQSAADGVDDVCEDYVCEGWDVVIKPSFERAELNPQRSALSTPNARMAVPAAPNPTAESKKSEEVKTITEAEVMDFLQKQNKVAVTKESLKESTTPSKTPTNSKRMEINEIKSRIQSITSVDPATLKIGRFTESIAHIEELHQQVAEWGAENPKQSYAAQKMHRELDQYGESLKERAKQPGKEVKRLGENNIKLMKVINATAGTAAIYKKKLSEALKKVETDKKMIEQLTTRGQGWQRLAESRKDKFLVLEKDFDTSCEALDLMSKRYHEDVTELARRVIVLEFKEKAQTPEIQKQLKEATRLRHIATIRESLEGPKDKDGKKAVSEEGVEGKQPKEGEQPSHEAIKDDKVKGAGSPDAAKVAAEPGKVKNESAEKIPAGTITEAKVMSTNRNIRDINEGIDLVKRLSGAASKQS